MATVSAGPLALVREWSRETLVSRGATALALLHPLDDAFLHRQPGVPSVSTR